jgi:ATP-dependent helicase HrpB
LKAHGSAVGFSFCYNGDPMAPLPIDPALPQVVAHLRDQRNLVLVASPGAGKTTRVPPAILRANLLPKDRPNLIVLQPRRVAARATAQWIAEENGWTLGREVGYHVRFDRKLMKDTRLRVLTEGILTRQLVDDPYLETVGGVVLDEFHERSLHSDLAIALLRELQQTVRDDLMLVVMSATLEAEPVARFLGNCPVVRVEGRTHPVDVTHLGSGPIHSMPDRVADALKQVDDDGDVLVFLPGAEEIRRTAARLESIAHRDDLLVLPLHGSLTAEEQMRALRPARQRKIVLATNIAETSLTIDGVTAVIDSGLARVASYDPQRGLDRLDLSRTSKASATQRAGRAGRTAPGKCLRLWSAREQQDLEDFEAPEVRRVDLAGTVLSLHAWGYADPRTFGWYEAPPEETLRSAEELLAMLGALEDGTITPLGRKMLSLPVHPRLARLLIGAAEAGRIDDGAAIAALLSEKDIALPPELGPGPRAPTAKGDSDVLIRLDMLAEAERDRFAMRLRDRGIDPITARRVAMIRDDLLRIGRDIKKNASANDHDILLKLPLLAYPDRVVRRRGADPRGGVMVGGGGIRLAAESVVWDYEFFVALDARHDARSTAQEALVRLASRIEPAWLEELFPNSIRRNRDAVYDEARDRVVGRGRALYRDLVIREDTDAAVDAATAGRVLGEWVRPRAWQLIESDEAARRWLNRLALLRIAMPEQEWPEIDSEWGRDAVAAACAGRRSLAEVRPKLLPVLEGLLEYSQDRMLETEAPETIPVPSGSRIRLEYFEQTDTDGELKPPVLAVRLQEVFGWTDTPRVAGGRVPVLLHLLAPNFRPVQITNDLRSFWSTTYFQVRKDLRTRYPKHAWPEDPLTAAPQAKGQHQVRGKHR